MLGKGSEGSLLDAARTLQLLNSSHVRERDKAVLRGVLVGVFGTDSCWGGCEDSLFRAGAVVVLMVTGIFLGNAPFPPLVEIRENPEFHDLMRMDKVASLTFWGKWTFPLDRNCCSGCW